MNRALVFKSVDARKQNPQNKPGKFTVKFIPELFLENNKQHFLALDHLSMTASWHNIRPEYENNKLVISKDGENWETITFPAGIFDYDDINEFIHKRIGKTDDEYGISVLFDLTTYKVFIQLANEFQIDFTKSGNFNVLLGFEKKLVSSSEYGKNFPNITNSVDNLYLRCSLLSDSIISGKRSNVLYSFSTSTKTRSMPFEIQPFNYLWSKINSTAISEVTFWFVDEQPKRNAYKISDSSFGNLSVDVPKLKNEMKLNVFRGGKIVYHADADKSLVDLLTKRFNPRSSYSLNAVKIFNDLNLLANLPRHPSSGKSKLLGSGVVYYNDPNELAERMKILVGSMAAGNNSPVIKNDLAMINDEFLKIGAIDKQIHEKFYNKYIK